MRPGAKKGRAKAGLLLGQEPRPWLLSHILRSLPHPQSLQRGHDTRAQGQRASLAASLLPVAVLLGPVLPQHSLCCSEVSGWEDVGRNCSRQEGMSEGQVGGDSVPVLPRSCDF